MTESAQDISHAATPGVSHRAQSTPAPAPDLLVSRLVDMVPGRGAHRPAGAPSWLVLWTLDGAGAVRQGDAAVTATPGRLIVLSSHAEHEYDVERHHEHWRLWWAHFQPRPQWRDWLLRFAVGPHLYHVGPVPPGVHQIVTITWSRLHTYLRWGGSDPIEPVTGPDTADTRPVTATHPDAYELGLSALEEILLLTTASVPVDQAAKEDPRVRHVADLIGADPGAPHTVDSLARTVALSQSRLAHLFAKERGRTLMQEVRLRRIAHAARLLEGTDLSVRSVASAAGFPNQFHFSKTFTQAMGLPPSRYRARKRTHN